MKLYRIRRVEGWADARKYEELWIPREDELLEPVKARIVKGEKFEVCKIVPACKKKVEVKKEAEQKTKTVVVPGHYETWYETIPAHEEKRDVWVKERVVEHPVIIPGDPKKGIPTRRTVRKEVIPGHLETRTIWVPEQKVKREEWIPEHEEEVTYIVAERVETEYVEVPAERVCTSDYEEDQAVFEAGVPGIPISELRTWFEWYQGTDAGQMFVKMAEHFGRLNEWTERELLMRAYEGARHFQPDVSVRVAPDVVVKINAVELERMYSSKQGLKWLTDHGYHNEARKLIQKYYRAPNVQLSELETVTLVKMGLIAGLVIAGVAFVYTYWPGRRYDVVVTYASQYYVGRYEESFVFLDHVSTSPKGFRYFVECSGETGSILWEERGSEADEWYFGEKYQYSSWFGTRKYLGEPLAHNYTKAEVKFEGFLTRTSAVYYRERKADPEIVAALGVAGWMRPSNEWCTPRVNWAYFRI